MKLFPGSRHWQYVVFPEPGIPATRIFPRTFFLRTATQFSDERSGTGNGRVYTIFFTAQNSHAGKSRGTVQVCVPHDQGGTCEFTGFHSKPAVDSTVCNPWPREP